MVKNLGRPAQRVQDFRYKPDPTLKDNKRSKASLRIEELVNDPQNYKLDKYESYKDDQMPLYQGPIVNDANKSSYGDVTGDELENRLRGKRNKYEKGWSKY